MDLYSASSRTRLYRFPYVGADLRYLVLSQTLAHTARPQIRASVSRDVPVYCAYPRKDASLVDLDVWFCTEVAYRPNTVAHPGTNRTWRRVTTLIETNVISLNQTGSRCGRPTTSWVLKPAYRFITQLRGMLFSIVICTVNWCSFHWRYIMAAAAIAAIVIRCPTYGSLSSHHM